MQSVRHIRPLFVVCANGVPKVRGKRRVSGLMGSVAVRLTGRLCLSTVAEVVVGLLLLVLVCEQTHRLLFLSFSRLGKRCTGGQGHGVEVRMKGWGGV
jgi:hypothetical protein